MPLFRQHCSSLEDSLATVVEVATLADLVAHLKKIELLEDGSKLLINKYRYDPRCNWDTHIVTVNGRAVGFTNSKLT